MKTVGTNDEVGKAWLLGHPMRSHNGNFKTDGVNLWSYALQIGKRDEQTNEPLLLNVRGLISPTTSEHVSCAITYDKDTPKAILIRPAVEKDNFSKYTRYSFPTSKPEVAEGWLQNDNIVRFLPQRVRTDFRTPKFTQITEMDRLNSYKLPAGTTSAFIRTRDEWMVGDEPLPAFKSFWISSDDWNYVPAKKEERVYMREFTHEDGERSIFSYYVTRPGKENSRDWFDQYVAETDVWRVTTSKSGALLVEHEYSEFLMPGRVSKRGRIPENTTLHPYAGGMDKTEFPQLLKLMGDHLESPIRVVERDNSSYRTVRNRLAREGY